MDITSGPSGSVASTSADFAFSTSPVRSTAFSCALDGGAPVACGSSAFSGAKTYQGLAEGPHTFVVTSNVGVSDTATAQRTWTVDTTPPDTQIVSAPSGVTASSNAAIAFTATEPATFACTLDAMTGPCTSPAAYAHLAAGLHSLSVIATDSAGNTDPSPAIASWKIGVRSLGLVSPVLKVKPRPRKLKRASLFRNVRPKGFAPRPARRGDGHGADDEGLAGIDLDQSDDSCVLIVCTPLEGLNLPLRTPSLSSGPFTGTVSGGDPNIAASREFLVATTYNKIWFLTKSGKLLTTDRFGNPIANPVPTGQFFAPFYDPADPHNIDTALNLPAGLKCDPTIFPFGSLTSAQKAATADCLDDIYDLRVIFDGFRKRFWILTSARNDFAGAYLKLSDPKQRVGRRNRLFLAVSVDEDPRDGWYMYPLWADIDDGACTSIGNDPGPPPMCPGSNYRPGDASDYPSIGISKDYVVTTIGTCGFNPWDVGKADADKHPGDCYVSINVLDANKLANGGCNSPCGWNYGRIEVPEVGRIGGIVQPSVSHNATPGGWTLMSDVLAWKDAVLVLGLKKSDGLNAPLHAALVPVQPIADKVSDLSQSPAGTVTTPHNVLVSNLVAGTLKSVARDGRVWTTFQDCRKWVDTLPACATSVHVVGIDAVSALEGNTVTPFVDRIFGMRNPLDDPADAVIGYGNPEAEVNKKGDVVAVYNRSGPGVPFEARYSAFMHGEADVRPSAVLQKGTGTVGGNYPSGANDPLACCNEDTAGITVDPWDGTAIWMMHAYASSGNAPLAIGKTLGAPVLDLSTLTGKGLGISAPNGVLPGKTVVVNVPVSNDGDRNFDADLAKTASGLLTLRKAGSASGRPAKAVKFAIPALAPGQAKLVGVPIPLAAGFATGKYDLRVSLDSGVPEYSTTNDVGTRKLLVSGQVRARKAAITP